MLLDIQGDMNAIKNTMNELKKLSDEEKAEKYFISLELEKVIEKMWKVYLDGLAEGRKEICKLCETKIKEKGKSCAYRSCGNEYCWEK